MKQILSIDIGTSNVRAILINEKGKLTGIEKMSLSPIYPYHGQIEMDPEEIFQNVLKVIEKVILSTDTSKEQILCMGISNSLDTTIVWDKITRKPVWNAIICGDRRNQKFCEDNKEKSEFIKEKTALPLSCYGSATKIRWILKNAKIENKDNCLFGTLNTWILWRLTNAEEFVTDICNASRTMLFNIHENKWDNDLLKFFNIKKQMLPAVKSCSEVYGYTHPSILGAKIPISSMIGDSQSALFASGCHSEGMANLNAGAGAFLIMNTGEIRVNESKDLISSIAYQRKGFAIKYSLESALYSFGSVVEWLKSYTGIIYSAKEIEGLAYSVPDSMGVYFVPALNGLFFPFQNQKVTGAIFGITPSTNIGHICRALMEGVSFMLSDAQVQMEKVYKNPKNKLKCSGGVAENNFLMQMSADLMESHLVRSKELELSAFGAAYLSALAINVWKNEKEIESLFEAERKFSPKLDKKNIDKMRKNWEKGLNLCISF
jgi:glycerol kinase